MSTLSFEPGAATSALTSEAGTFLFREGFNSDFTIKCRGKEWKVHQGILEDRSDYFHALLGSDRWREKDSGFIEIQEDQPEIVHSALEHIYTLDYSIPVFTAEEQIQFCDRIGTDQLKAITAPKDAHWQLLDGTEVLIEHTEEEDVSLVTYQIEYLILLSMTADRLGIMMDRSSNTSALSAHAEGLLREKLYPHLCQSSFQSIVKLVLHVLPISHSVRRDIVDLCIFNHKLITEHNPPIGQLLQTYEEAPWVFGCRLYSRLESRIESMKARVTALEQRLEREMPDRKLKRPQ